MSRPKIIILGSGTPNAEADRAGSGIAVVVEGVPYLVDCGHGIVHRVVEAQSRGLINWNTSDLTRLFVTHLHADHTVGIPDLLYTPWIHGRKEAVNMWGPAALQPMIEHIHEAWSANREEHLRAHPVSGDGCQAQVHAVREGLIHRDERVEVHALPADHGALEAWSYKFVTPDSTIVVSGDTKIVPGFAEWAEGSDILIHEVYTAARLPQRPAAWQDYHSRVHTSTRELAALARASRPRLLVLVHQLFWGATPAELVAEVREDYAGEVVSANDLDVFLV